MKLLVRISALFFLLCAAVTAQSNAAPGAVEAPFTPPVSDEPLDIFSLTPKLMLEEGGWPVIVLFVLSGIGLALVLYLVVVLRTRTVAPPSFLRDVEVMVKANRLDEARKACLRSKSPAAAMTMAALDYVEQAEGFRDTMILKETIESEGSRQAKLLQLPTRYLSDIASIAPMIGLFGTLLGMFGTFASKENLVDIKPAALAYGVGQALMTTLVGIMVAVPMTMFYAYFRNKAVKLITHLEIVGADLLTLFQKRS